MLELLNSKKTFYYSISFISIILVFVCFYFDGTGGGGDSIFHYEYAKYAPSHPENYFNHWAKPVFTILSSPFAQFGFIGIKLFNLFMSLTACYFTYKTLKKIEIKNSEWIALILFSITLFVTVTISGLTEPLSAAILMLSIYLVVKNKNGLGVSIISFLPFVRSEGLVILGVFFIYLLISKKYKYIPFLALGHLVMSVIGSFFYHDLLWVFNKIPYATAGLGYGKGTWFHFVEQLFFQLGLIEYSLLILGGIAMLFTIFKRESKTKYFNEKLWLIYGCFMAFFIAHTSFWALGIFNSMGLSRVFVSVMPLVSIIVLDGLNFIETNVSKYNVKLAQIVKIIILITMTIFPFLNSPSSYKLPQDFELEASQSLIKNKVVPYLNLYKQNATIVIADVSIPFFKNADPFDNNKVKFFYEYPDLSKIKPNEIIVWDTWLSTIEFGVTLDKLNKIESLKMDTIFLIKNKQGRETEYAIYSKK